MRVDKLVPEVYYKESRDFSYIGRLFEIMFNYMKTGADLVEINPINENITSNMLDLLVNTLGFESKHEYILKDLINIASVFSDLLKHKGTKYAVETAIKTLLNSQNIDSNLDVVVGEDKSTDDKYTITIYLPRTMKDIILLEDLLDYILPAGWLYNFILIEYNSHDKATWIGSKNTVGYNNKIKTYGLGEISSHIPSQNYIDSLDAEHRSFLTTGIVVNEDLPKQTTKSKSRKRISK